MSAVRPDDVQALAVLDRLEPNTSGDVELRFVHEDGDIRHLLAQCGKGRQHRRVMALMEVTEIKRLQEQRTEALQKAEQIQRQRAQDAEDHRRNQELFIDMICHEIRNPLSAIFGIIEQMRASAQDRTAQIHAHQYDQLESSVRDDLDALAALERCATHQRLIADDIVNKSKMSAGKFAFSSNEFRMSDVVGDVVRMFSALAAREGLRVAADVAASDRNTWLRSDRQRISQVITNLVSNAIKFIGGRPERIVTLRVRLQPQNASSVVLHMPVAHSGIGMTSHEQMTVRPPKTEGIWLLIVCAIKIFDRFGQLRNAK